MKREKKKKGRFARPLPQSTTPIEEENNVHEFGADELEEGAAAAAATAAPRRLL